MADVIYGKTGDRELLLDVYLPEETDTPPLLLLHGDQDPQMPINQSHELHHAYKQLGLDVAFEVVHGAAHGGPEFVDEPRNTVVLAFLNKHLK